MMNGMMNIMMDHYMKRMMQEPYTENIFSFFTIMQKLTPRAIFEAGMRAETGKPINRPLGSPNGQGAQAAAPMSMSSTQIGDDLRKAKKLKPGEDAVIHSRLPGVNNVDDLIKTIQSLKQSYDVPVGVKISATHYIEQELDIAIQAGVDYFVVDGAEAGTHGGPTTLQDDVGLPTLFALSRTIKHLEERGVKKDISVIASGGLTTPGHFLKAMALGAD